MVSGEQQIRHLTGKEEKYCVGGELSGLKARRKPFPRGPGGRDECRLLKAPPQLSLLSSLDDLIPLNNLLMGRSACARRSLGRAVLAVDDPSGLHVSVFQTQLSAPLA